MNSKFKVKQKVFLKSTGEEATISKIIEITETPDESYDYVIERTLESGETISEVVSGAAILE